MNVLITGGAGYLGCRLVGNLLRLKFNVTVVDDFRYGQRGLLYYCNQPNFKVVKGYCNLSALMKPLVADADVIFPFAGVVGNQICEAYANDAVLVNSVAVADLLDWASQGSRERLVVFPMTNAGYRVESGGIATEDTPMEARTVYASTKMMAEQAVLKYRLGISLRLASVYGSSPEMRDDRAPLLNWMVKEAVARKYLTLSGPEVKRDVVHISDAVNAFVWAMMNYEKTAGQAFNVGRGAFTKLELCQTIRELVPNFFWELLEDAYEDPDQRDFAVSYEKIRQLGFSCTTPLVEGIEDLIKAYTMVG